MMTTPEDPADLSDLVRSIQEQQERERRESEAGLAQTRASRVGPRRPRGARRLSVQTEPAQTEPAPPASATPAPEAPLPASPEPDHDAPAPAAPVRARSTQAAPAQNDSPSPAQPAPAPRGPARTDSEPDGPARTRSTHIDSTRTEPAPASPSARPDARQRKRRRLLIATAIGAAAVLLGGGAAWAGVALLSDDSAEVADPSPKTTPKTTPSPEPKPEEPAPTEPPAPEPPQPQWSLDDPASLQVVVNKQRPLNPIDWAPSDLVMPNVPNANGQPLRAEAAAALEAMHAEATAAGVPFTLVSAFRDYNLQTSLFNNYAASDGIAAAETYSARPGHSEHQTGLAADISECMGCGLSEAFGETPQGQWARANAPRFGFILRYDQGQEPVVGYVYEPWHFRYVGTEIAMDMQAKGIVNLEEYLGLPAAPTY
ncbi:hypothetical protein GCM10027033_12130 [Leucobacter ruminantium]